VSFVCAEGLDALFRTVIQALTLFVERLHKSFTSMHFQPPLRICGTLGCGLICTILNLPVLHRSMNGMNSLRMISG